MASIDHFSKISTQNKWLEWINSPIYFNEADRYDEPITVRQFLETVFIKLFEIFKSKKIYFRVRDNLILNDVVNYYFNLWRGSKKGFTAYNYSLTQYGKSQKMSGTLPSFEVIEYLDGIFNDIFWYRMKNKYGKGYGLFDPELSEFGSIFWENVRYFLYQYVDIENIVGQIYLDRSDTQTDRNEQTIRNNSNRDITIRNKDALVNIAYRRKLASSNSEKDDPYLVDQQIAQESGAVW